MISTEDPMKDGLIKKILELQGEPVARDARTMLFDELKPMTQRDGGDLARAQGAPVIVSLHDPDEVVTFSDGRQFQATPDGWIRIDPEREAPRTETYEADPVADAPTTEGDPDHG